MQFKFRLILLFKMQVDFSGMRLPGAEFQEPISSSNISSSSNKLLKITPHPCEITLQLLCKTAFNSLEIRGSYTALGSFGSWAIQVLFGIHRTTKCCSLHFHAALLVQWAAKTNLGILEKVQYFMFAFQTDQYFRFFNLWLLIFTFSFPSVCCLSSMFLV